MKPGTMNCNTPQVPNVPASHTDHGPQYLAPSVSSASVLTPTHSESSQQPRAATVASMSDGVQQELHKFETLVKSIKKYEKPETIVVDGVTYVRKDTESAVETAGLSDIDEAKLTERIAKLLKGTYLCVLTSSLNLFNIIIVDQSTSGVSEPPDLSSGRSNVGPWYGNPSDVKDFDEEYFK